jgi:hypothetical protein
MTAYFKDGQLLFEGGAFAASSACCCDVINLCDTSNPNYDPSNFEVIVTGLMLPCVTPHYSECSDLVLNGTYPYGVGNWTNALTGGQYGCINTDYWFTRQFQVGIASLCTLIVLRNRVAWSSGSTYVTVASLTVPEVVEPDTDYILTPSTGNLTITGLGTRQRQCTVDEVTVRFVPV